MFMKAYDFVTKTPLRTAITTIVVLGIITTLYRLAMGIPLVG